MQTGPIPSVSVVMPAYNAEKYLREAIDSILAQTYQDFEFIIINDGSSDSTKQIIQSYSDPRIVYLENDKNSGICVTLNKGLDAARGRYIARMDADDIAMPERLAKQTAYMDAHPEVGVCGTSIEEFGEDIKPYHFDNPFTDSACRAGLLFNSCFAHSTVMLRQSVLLDHRLGYDDNFRGLEDYHLWWRISRHSRLANIPDVLLRYRHHVGQVTQNISAKTRGAYLRFVSIRLCDMNVHLDQDALSVFGDYCLGDFSQFDKDRINVFFDALVDIKDKYQMAEKAQQKDLIECLGRAVTFTLSKTGVKGRRCRWYYNRAFRKGIMPFIWYCKVMYHSLMR